MRYDTPTSRVPHPRALRLDPARLAGALALGTIVLGCLVVVAVAAHPPGSLSPPAGPNHFPTWLSGPLRGLWPFPGTPTTMRRIFDLAVVGMYLAYLAAVLCVPRLPRRWTLGAILAVHLTLLLAPPLPLTDVFNYVNYGRMEIVHQLNPYATIPALEPHTDPAYVLSNWHHLLSPYGPLFTILTFALVPLGVAAAFWALKATLVLASLGILLLVWRCAELLGRDPLRAVLLVGLNPPVLIWGLGGDHNDYLMVLLMMVAVYLLVYRAVGGRDAPRARAATFGAGLALAAACAVKLPAAVIAPIVLAAVASRRRIAAGLAGGLAAVALASYAAFGAHLPDLGVQSQLVTPVGLPNLLGTWAGLGGEPQGLRVALTAVLLLVLALGVLWASRHPADWVLAAAGVVFALVVTLSWQAPWYLLWLLPLVALADRPRLRVATLLLGVYMVVAYGSLVNIRPSNTARQQMQALQTQRLVH